MSNRVAAIQMTSGIEVKKNLEAAGRLIEQAVAEGAQLIVLPENFAIMGKTDGAKLLVREALGTGPIQDFLSAQAAKHHIWLVGGTIPIAADDATRVYNACLVYNASGERVARYDKIHLFDAQVKPNVEVYEESKTIVAGDKEVVVETPLGRLGLAVCYDVRFPELFRALFASGAQLIAIPTAFTVKTGEAHWEVLIRARAIENFCYVIGACQSGHHENDRQTYGNSLIVDPWGTVVARLPSMPGVLTAEIDLAKQQRIRGDFPVDKHRRNIF